MKQGTISFSWGRYGGFYFYRGFSTRLCLGWFALTFIPAEIDDMVELINAQKEYIEFCELDGYDLREIYKTDKEIIEAGIYFRNKIEKYSKWKKK